MVVANEAEVALSAPEVVRTNAETDATAPASVQQQQVVSESLSPLIVDSDCGSVYSVCCSDVTNADSAPPDIVHVDHQTTTDPGHRGTTSFIPSD